MGPLFAIMFVVIAAVAGGAYYMFGGENARPQPKPPQPRPEPIEVYVDLKNRAFPAVEPWEGEVAGVSGRVAVGMTRDQVIQQFGRPHTSELDFHRTDNGIEQLEWYDAVGDGRGTFRSGKGVRLIVKLDRGEDRTVSGDDKVVWFLPPQRIPEELRKQLEAARGEQ